MGYGQPYSGSEMLESLAYHMGVPLDQLNFVVTQVIGILFSVYLKNFLCPSKTNPATRHKCVLAVGLFLSYFAFGAQVWYLIAFTTVCYILLLVTQPDIVQRLTMIFALSFLSAVHYNRLLYDDGTVTLELTGPLMVMVQKATCLAFFYHDGHDRKTNLNESQLKTALKDVPTLLEYFSYMFQYQTLMAGPLILYNDYLEFVSGENLSKYRDEEHPNEPSPTFVGIKKISIAIFCGMIYATAIPYFKITRLKDADFLQRGIPYQMTYIVASTTVTRFKYYHAWILAEGICNLSGIGFSGYGPNGEETWDLVNNIEIIGFEFGANLRDCIAAWNKGTNLWLRIAIYDRLPKSSYKLLLTFLLSAVWHGFYPGYYITFLTGALFTSASRVARSHLRPHFLSSSAKKKTYDVATVIFTRVALGYMTFSFILLEFWSSVRVYWNMYFWLHLVAAVTIAGAPRFLGQDEAPLRNRLTKLVTSSNGVNSLHGY